MTLSELIAALEAATGPSLNLDAMIRAHVNTEFNPRFPTLPYTASLDAALSLVPEGWRTNLWIGTDHARAMMERLPGKSDGSGATPAIALCIAALKARTP